MPRKRPYLASGMYRRQPPSPEVQQAMAELRAQLIADKGGEENVSTAERMLIDLAVDAYMKKQSVAAFLLTLPELVDKRRRRVWQVVKDDVSLGTHLQSLLRDLGLERRAKDVDDLHSYIAGKARDGAPAEPEASPPRRPRRERPDLPRPRRWPCWALEGRRAADSAWPSSRTRCDSLSAIRDAGGSRGPRVVPVGGYDGALRVPARLRSTRGGRRPAAQTP
jgi:hypothetical protein